MEYGFKWAVVFHIINNFLISDMLARFVGLLPNTLQDPVHMVVTVGFGLLGILVLLKNRRAIAAYIADNRTCQASSPSFGPCQASGSSCSCSSPSSA